ncbi:hypothetical protein MASR2M54_27490 [Aliarcobacter cryaerophilus]
MFENKYIQQRIEKADALRELGINPYANDSKKRVKYTRLFNKK